MKKSAIRNELTHGTGPDDGVRMYELTTYVGIPTTSTGTAYRALVLGSGQ